jgi:hypothetical protein
MPLAEKDQELLNDIFKYHAPDQESLVKYAAVRAAALAFASALFEHVPACADRSAALRKIREATMTANSAIATKGRI